MYPDYTTPVNRAISLKYEKAVKNQLFYRFFLEILVFPLLLFSPTIWYAFFAENEETPNKSARAADKKRTARAIYSRLP